MYEIVFEICAVRTIYKETTVSSSFSFDWKMPGVHPNRAAVVAAFQQGDTVPTIAKRLRMHRRTVSRIVQRFLELGGLQDRRLTTCVPLWIASQGVSENVLRRATLPLSDIFQCIAHAITNILPFSF